MAALEFCEKHNMVAYLIKIEGSEEFHEIIDFLSGSHISYDLTESPILYREIIISEASLRRHLKLKDSEGISSLPNEDIFEQLTNMGYEITSDRLNFFKGMVKNLNSTHKFLMYPRFIQIILNKYQGLLLQHNRTYVTPTLTNKLFNNMRRPTKGYSRVVTPLFATILVQPHGQTSSTSLSRITSSPSQSLEPTPEHTTTAAPSTPQHSQPSPAVEEPVPTPHDSPLNSVHSPGSDEGRLQLNELTDLVTKLSDRIGVLENDLQKTKKTYSSAFTQLILRVKKLEKHVKTGKARKISDIDEDPNIFLVQDDGVEWFQEDTKVQDKASNEIELVLQEVTPTEVIHDQGSSEKGQPKVSTADILVSTTRITTGTASVTPGTAIETPIVSTAGVNISSASPIHSIICSTARRVMYRRRSEETRKYKGKAIMTELEPVKKSKKQMEQERLAYDIDWNDPQVIRYHALQNRPRLVIEDSDIKKEVIQRKGFDFQQESKKTEESFKRKTSKERVDMPKKQKSDKDNQ
ncbi:hypothetical protein Tco_1337522 [Tanacetum coccineum]